MLRIMGCPVVLLSKYKSGYRLTFQAFSKTLPSISLQLLTAKSIANRYWKPFWKQEDLLLFQNKQLVRVYPELKCEIPQLTPNLQYPYFYQTLNSTSSDLHQGVEASAALTNLWYHSYYHLTAIFIFTCWSNFCILSLGPPLSISSGVTIWEVANTIKEVMQHQ